MASVGEFTVLISRVGNTMGRTPLGVLGDFLLHLRRLFYRESQVFIEGYPPGTVNATKRLFCLYFCLSTCIFTCRSKPVGSS